MNKLFFVILLILSIAALYAQDGKSYQANNYSVDMYLNNDGTVRIAEEVVFQFTGGPFHYVNRDLTNSNVNRLIFQDAAMDSLAITTNSTPNYYTLNTRNGLHLKWYYAPLNDETHSFYFQYIVKGIYSLDNGMAHLLWKPLPTEFGYYMNKAVVRVHLPKEIPASRLTFGNRADQIPIITGDSLLTYQYLDLAPNTVKRIDMLFPQNLIQVEKPHWVSYSEDTNGNMIKWIVFSMLIFFLIFVSWIIITTKRMGKYSKYMGEEIVYEDLPTSTEPALLGRMINGSYGMAASVYATMVNLAQKGVIKIQSLPKTKWYEVGGSMSFEYVENQVELTAVEQAILELLYGKPPVPGTIKLIDLQKLLMKNAKYLRSIIEDSMVQNSFLDPFQVEKRNRIMLTGGILSAADFALLIGGIIYFGTVVPAFLIAFIGLFFTGMILLMTGGAIRVFTDTGMMELASWNAYAKYLRKIMKEPNTYSSDDFNRIFPYALVMNLGSEWVSFFKKAGIDVGPVWLTSQDTNSDSWAPLIMISTISSPSSGSSGGSSGGGGGGGGGGSGAG